MFRKITINCTPRGFGNGKQYFVGYSLKHSGKMKTSLNKKFKSNFKFVQPLYRKAKFQCESDNNTVPICFDRTVNLGGDEIDVKTVVAKGVNVLNIKREINKECNVILPGTCDINNKRDDNNFYRLYNKVLNEKIIRRDKIRRGHLREPLDYNRINSNVERQSDNGVSIKNCPTMVINKIPETWLRIYPAPKLPRETICSVIIRCFMCQLGLITFLTIWTMIAVFLIQYFEGPNEIKVSYEFEKDQNQLVIDLATELRQITPISPTWRYAIERRIEDERKLTMRALKIGAKIKPGRFWNLSGTFLFTIYVMTALGFGAPIPHTIWGRVMAVIYAVFAAPTHIYLIMNATTCIMVRLEGYTKCLRSTSDARSDSGTDARRYNTGSPNTHKTSETSNYVKESSLKHICLRGVSALMAGHCVPVPLIVYYTFGLISFGFLRNKSYVDAFMFPLEFTTSGGLEFVEGHVRVLYGVYVEGAMFLFACTLTRLRRLGDSSWGGWGEHYRLFDKDTE